MPYGSTAHIHKNHKNTQELKTEKAKTFKVAHDLQLRDVANERQISPLTESSDSSSYKLPSEIKALHTRQ